MIALFRATSPYCVPKKYYMRWWLVEVETLPAIERGDNWRVPVRIGGCNLMFKTPLSEPGEPLYAYSMFDLENAQWTPGHEWPYKSESDNPNNPPSWIYDPLSVAIKLAQIKDRKDRYANRKRKKQKNRQSSIENIV